MTYDESIEKFWENNPCGSDFISGEPEMDFFINYDYFKFYNESHIPVEIGKFDLKGKRLLEIGTGMGAEASLLIQGGCIYNGIDFTDESLKIVKKRFDIFNLRYESLQKMNAEEIKFEDNSFDYIFSHGVIHHSPYIDKIISEMYRVLKPGGKFAVMVYHKNSLNYHISIKIIRRIGIFLLFLKGFDKIIAKLTREPLERLQKHKYNLKKSGIDYLKIKNFIHKATDGPDNIYSSAFTQKELKKMFGKFNSLWFKKFYLSGRHFPVIRYLRTNRMKEYIESIVGWHIWIYGNK